MAIKEIKSDRKPASSLKPPEAAVPPVKSPEFKPYSGFEGLTVEKPSTVEEIEANEEANAELEQPKTEAPEEEAHSHKPTFGESAEKPEKTEPEGDPTIEPEGLTAIETLDKRVEDQANQLNPDQVQEDGHWPSTESLLAAPKTRPHTIDGATGHIIYKGDVAQLPGGNVDGEGIAED